MNSSSSSPTKTTSNYNSMIEARDLSWVDTFFDNEEGVVAVFDLDYEKMEVFKSQVAIAGQASTMSLMSVYGLLLHPFVAAGVWGMYGLSCAPCLTRYQIQWEVRAQHVAITQDGIRFVQDKRKSMCGWSMCDKGKHSKTVPFDKITDCDIVEPAGNECLCIPRVLMTVMVDTASSGGGGGIKSHDLAISGLKDPHAFKQLVWAMKRSRGGDSKQYQTPQTATMMDRGGENNDSGVAGLLKEIRDELRENNTLLRKMKGANANVEQEEEEDQGPLETAVALIASEREVV